MLTYAAYQVATVEQLLRERFDCDEVQVSASLHMLTYAHVCSRMSSSCSASEPIFFFQTDAEAGDCWDS
jgi:hypothetical protein